MILYFNHQIWLNHANFKNKIRFCGEFDTNERKLFVSLRRNFALRYATRTKDKKLQVVS